MHKGNVYTRGRGGTAPKYKGSSPERGYSLIFLVSALSEASEHGGSELLTGRPFGGCAIIWKCLVVSYSDDMCCCAIGIELNVESLLLFNVYMPCDSESDYENVEEFGVVLRIISNIADNQQVREIIIGGYFNTDFRRTRSLHTQKLMSFMHFDIA